MREAGHLVRDLLIQLHKIIIPGVNELDIVSFCENYILIRGADPVLKTGNIYPYCILISRNNVAFHGLPEDYQLLDGDVITVDVVLQKNGWFGDGAWTYIVGEGSESLKEIVRFSNEIIFKAVDLLKKTGDINAIGKLISRECELSDYRVLEEGAGHGIGRSIHEDPQILFTSEADSIELKPGMVFTIEPVFTNSTQRLQYRADGAAFVEEGCYAVQFEHMIAVNDWGIEFLTGRDPKF